MHISRLLKNRSNLEIHGVSRKTPSRSLTLRRARVSCQVLAACALTTGSMSVAQADAFGESWPAGEGREFTGAFCGGCHSLNLVTQQGLTRPGWDKLLHWMTEKQNMPPIAGAKRDEVLDYLAANFNVDHTAASVASDDGSSLPPLPSAQGVMLPILEMLPQP